MTTTHPFFCGKDCGGDACPLLASVENGRVMHIRQNPAGGAFIKGCWRGLNTTLQTHYAPDRLLTPLVRVGERGSGHFRPASWEEALQLTAEKLAQVRARYGSQAILNLGSAGATGALHNTPALLSRFLNLFGGGTNLSGSYSNGAARFVLPFLLGEDWKRAGFDAATLQYAEMIILWGANLLETRLGSENPARLLEARRRGVPVVVIDPRRSATVQRAASWWLAPRPGTDAALMLAVLYVLLDEGLADETFIATHSAGFDQLADYVLGRQSGQAHSPEWAAAICGLEAQEIVRFGRAYAAARPAMLLPGYSIQRIYAGEETYRLAVALQIATGNFGRRGGSTGALNSRLPAPRVGTLDSCARPDAVSLPVLRWPDAVLEGHRGGYPSDIHAIYSLGNNFVNQGGDVHKSIAAFQAVDFAVCHEVFLTPTARQCDVVFPAATALEKEDIGVPWLGNHLLYRPQILPPAAEARSDYDILCALADRLGFGPAFSEGRSAAQWIQHFLDQSEVPDHEAFRRSGVYLAPDQERSGLSDFAADPQAHPLTTPSGKVEIASQRYQQQTGFPAIPTWQAPPTDERYPLRLLTPKSAYRTHSQGSNLAASQQKAAHALEMHPLDAAQRGITDGDRVRLFNERGAARLPVRLTEDLIPGVVCLPEGVWLALEENGEDLAGSANMFTSTTGTAASTSCIMHAVAVEVQR